METEQPWKLKDCGICIFTVDCWSKVSHSPSCPVSYSCCNSSLVIGFLWIVGPTFQSCIICLQIALRHWSILKETVALSWHRFWGMKRVVMCDTGTYRSKVCVKNLIFLKKSYIHIRKTKWCILKFEKLLCFHGWNGQNSTHSRNSGNLNTEPSVKVCCTQVRC